MNLNKLAKQIHEIAKEKGWWNRDCSFGETIALCHSELSEALEEYRNRFPVSEIRYQFDNNKPLGVPIELADTIIRILDFCGKENIDIEKAIQVKIRYNKERSFKHGNKLI